MTQLILSNYLPKLMVITPVGQLFKAVLSPLKSLHRSHQRSRKAHETIRELNKLSNYELKDIGLSRGDIYSVAHDHFSDYSVKIVTSSNLNLKGWV
jgi:uncharacterized protein YjiS (DUF1127 family)